MRQKHSEGLNKLMIEIKTITKSKWKRNKWVRIRKKKRNKKMSEKEKNSVNEIKKQNQIFENNIYMTEIKVTV